MSKDSITGPNPAVFCLLLILAGVAGAISNDLICGRIADHDHPTFKFNTNAVYRVPAGGLSVQSLYFLTADGEWAACGPIIIPADSAIGYCPDIWE